MTLVDLFDVERIAAVVLLVLGLGLYLAMTAGRLDRLHIRHDAALASLELQFALRAEAVAEVISTGFVDPVSAQLLGRALAARRVGGPINVVAETELSALLREVVEAHDGEVAPSDLQAELRSACNRTEHAFRFFNDAVDAANGMRMRPIVKYLGLAGHTAYPMHVRCDVLPPEFAD